MIPCPISLIEMSAGPVTIDMEKRNILIPVRIEIVTSVLYFDSSANLVIEKDLAAFCIISL
jgi:hypothetical protein